MPRRRREEDATFGSDSFLDIVANIVGILIILVVIAGVRVSRAPVVVSQAAPELAEQIRVPAETPVAVPPQPAAFDQPARLIEPPSELVQLAATLEKEIAALEAEGSGQAAALSRAEQQGQVLTQKLAAAEAQARADRERARTAARQLADLRGVVDEKKTVLAEYQAELRRLEGVRPPVESVEHRVTPIAQTVTGKEIHFRLANGRVAPVPVDEFISTLRERIEARKDWIIKYRQHQGTVGPVGGFTMHYLVERQGMSVVDELRYGNGMVRITVSQWEIHPEPGPRGETADEALRPGSAFHQALLEADRDTTITFWVYPDSFGLYRRLQKLTRDAHLTIAARPLPEGVPIAGSPNGSRSAGQ